jgi:hypothetical protein
VIPRNNMPALPASGFNSITSCHSRGGRSSESNVVVTCALCNFGKDKYTLRQLDVADPRLTEPVPCEWDGLERFR